MPIVAFDPREFRTKYPEYRQFREFSETRLEHFFEIACGLVSNTKRSVVSYNPPEDVARKTILYLLVAHQCELSRRGGGVVGAITNTSQGSTSAGFSASTNRDAEWFNQTQHGATAYQMLLPYALGGRLFHGCIR